MAKNNPSPRQLDIMLRLESGGKFKDDEFHPYTFTSLREQGWTTREITYIPGGNGARKFGPLELSDKAKAWLAEYHATREPAERAASAPDERQPGGEGAA